MDAIDASRRRRGMRIETAKESVDGGVRIVTERVPQEGKDGQRMPKGDVETYFEDGRWKNKIEGSSRAANTFDTKTEAQAKGREMARKRKVEHLIRKKDGTIGERNTYGNDPSNIPG